MSYIAIAVPRNITNSELIVAVPTLPAEEIPVGYSLEGPAKELFVLNVTRGEMTLHTKAQLPSLNGSISSLEYSVQGH